MNDKPLDKVRASDDYMGAGAIAAWLRQARVSAEEFQREPKKWLGLALDAVRANQAELDKKAALDESSGTGSGTISIKGAYGISGGKRKPKKRKKKRSIY